MDIKEELLDELLKEYTEPNDLLGKGGIIDQLKKRLIERALDGEMTHHLGYEKHEKGGGRGNARNGTSRKRVITDTSELHIEVPRDRNSSFEPQLVRKRQSRIDGFDEKVLSLYASGMSTREIQRHLGELYSIEVSPDMISTVTDAVIDEVRQWQARPLEKLYPIVYLDALIVKIRDEGRVKNKAVHIALGIGLDGKKEVLGMWIEENEGAKFWMRVLSEIKNRGVDDILIACCDGLTGFADAIAAVYPHTQVQLCLVHMVRQSTRFVVAKDRREVIASLKNIYYAPTIEAAEIALDELQQNWQQKYPTVVRSWQNNWPRITPCFAYPQELRRLVYTTNAIESMNYSLRKLLKTKALFPTDESVIKLLYLGLRNLSKKWIIMVKDWPLAYNQIAILFQERLI